ncbi:MAG: TrpR-like protein [Oscillospiraceae bacterium]|nr:TrpR-like protein [Oscillospiraceae bacterium]
MNKLNNKQRSDTLYKALLTLQNEEECRLFFEALCSQTELIALEQRALVAYCLDHGMVYADIVARTGASSATVSRVNRSLQYGAGGYQIAFERMAEDRP